VKTGWSQVETFPCEGYTAFLTENPEGYPYFCVGIRIWIPMPPMSGVQFADRFHHKQFLYRLIETANAQLSHFSTSSITKANYRPANYVQPPIRTWDTRIRLQLIPHTDSLLDPDQDGIIFFPTTQHWWYVPASLVRENGERIPTQDSTLDKYVPRGIYMPFGNQIRDENCFNLVLLAYPPELIHLIQKEKARALTHGWTTYYNHLLYLGGLFNRWYAQDFFYFQSQAEFWNSCSDTLSCLFQEQWISSILTTYARTLVHELFHAMGLRHITEPDEAGFQGTDCPDTPQIPKQEDYTNNIMEMGYYNGISPCQIALLWKHLLCHANLKQKLCDASTYTQIQDTFRIPMGSRVVWTIPITVHVPVVVESFSELTIRGTTVKFDSSAAIILQPNARLRLEEAILTSTDGFWKGILFPSPSKQEKKKAFIQIQSRVEHAQNQ